MLMIPERGRRGRLQPAFPTGLGDRFRKGGSKQPPEGGLGRQMGNASMELKSGPFVAEPLHDLPCGIVDLYQDVVIANYSDAHGRNVLLAKVTYSKKSYRSVLSLSFSQHSSISFCISQTSLNSLNDSDLIASLSF